MKGATGLRPDKSLFDLVIGSFVDKINPFPEILKSE